LKNSNTIWIVANITRAVDDKTAKDMLGESFRRQVIYLFIYLFIFYFLNSNKNSL